MGRRNRAKKLDERSKMDDEDMNRTNFEETKGIDVSTLGLAGLAVAPSVEVRSVHLRDPVQLRKLATNQTEVSGRFLTIDDIAANKFEITRMHTDGMLVCIESEIFADAAIPCSNILIMELAPGEFAASSEEGGPPEEPID